MRLSEKRKKWLTKKTLLNTIHVSAGVFVVATVFKIAESFIDASSTIEIRVISALASTGIVTLMFLISGIINPDFMDIVFRMLGFKEEKESNPENSKREKVEKINGKKDRVTLIITIINLSVIICFGISTAYYASTNTELNEIMVNLQKDLHDLTLESIRADLNVFIEPISVQNWTFVPEGVNVEVNGELTNEGSRTTMIKRIELYAIFSYSGGGEEIFTIPCNLTSNFNISKLTIGENEQHAFSIDCFIMNHLVVNNQTGQIMQIGSSMPTEVGIVIWHNDGIGNIIDSGET